MENPKSWVYFIQEGTDGPIKIGYTGSHPKVRLGTLQVGNSTPLRLMAHVPGTLRDEQGLHSQFAHLRVGGEWFRPGEDLLAHIASILSVHEEVTENEERSRLPCGLDRQDLHDIADFIECRSLHRAAYKLAKAVEQTPILPPLVIAEKIEALAEDLRMAYCGGGYGAEVFGHESLREMGKELLGLAKRVREKHGEGKN